MSATHMQFGATMHRINREPLDADSVKISYSDILNYVHPEQDPSGAAHAGALTAVTMDDNVAYNGLYLISYVNPAIPTSYIAKRLAMSYELDNAVDEIEDEVNTMAFEWGVIL